MPLLNTPSETRDPSVSNPPPFTLCSIHRHPSQALMLLHLQQRSKGFHLQQRSKFITAFTYMYLLLESFSNTLPTCSTPLMEFSPSVIELTLPASQLKALSASEIECFFHRMLLQSCSTPLMKFSPSSID